MADIPDSDADFALYGANVVAHVTATPAKWGLTPADLTDLLAANSDFGTKFVAHTTIQAQAKAATQAKDDSRYLKPTGFEPQLRAIRNRIGSHPGCDNSDRVILGIAIPGAPGPSDPPPPPSYPDGVIEHLERLKVTIGLRDSETGKKTLPSPVEDIEAWLAVVDQGAPEPPLSAFAYLARTKKSPIVANFTAADAGRVAHLVFRYRYKNGAFGSYSPSVGITIVG